MLNGTNCLRIFSSNLNTCRDLKTRSGILDYLKRFKPDIWMVQEVNVSTEELGALVETFDYNAACNVNLENETNRGTAFIWKKNIDLENIYTLEECRIQTAQVGRLNLLNIYAPSGSENKFARRELFNQAVMRWYRSAHPNLPLAGGDYNCVLGRNDARFNAERKGCVGLQALVNSFNLTDAYRYLFPDAAEYTFHRADSASRLDRYYVPQFMVPYIRSVQHLPQSFSDHSIVEIILEVPDLQRLQVEKKSPRFSYWKFNTGLIDEDFNENFEIIYNKAREYIGSYADIADWWDEKCKPMIIHFCKMYSISLARERKCTKDFLYIQLKNALNNGPFSEVIRIKEDLSKILIFESNGIKIRSRQKEDLEIEKASLYHINREIKQGEANNAESLLVGPPDSCYLETDPKKCKDVILNFFSALFSGRLGLDGEILNEPFEQDDQFLNEFLNDDLKKLNDEERYDLEKVFINDELELCIKSLPKHKTPGIDGLPFELYQSVFPIIQQDYLEVQNCIWERERITSSMRCSVTRLPPKIKQGTPTVLQLRPISMQISDYGIRNRLIASRMSKVMPSLLSSGQLCSQKEKNILFGITNIISSIEYVNYRGLSAAIASFDMDHAFDRAYIPYIIQVLRCMGFSDKFIRIIMDSHTDITTRFILNGLTEAIQLSFSFRQGDPISMILYLIYIEPLLVMLGKRLQGLQFPNFREIDDDYCDDIEILVEKEEDLLVADEIFRKFESFSGAKVNRSTKSKILGLGGFQDRQVWPLPWLKVQKSLKIFGIQIYPSYAQILESNWTDLLQKFRGKRNLRSLDTFQQRVDVLQIFGTSKLWYLSQVLPLPSQFANEN